MQSCCHYTGIRLRLSDAFLLDVGPTRRRVAALRTELALLERLLSDLAPIDIVKTPRYVGGRPTGQERLQYQRRIVCEAVAVGFSDSTGCAALFVPFDLFIAGRNRRREEAEEAAHPHDVNQKRECSGHDDDDQPGDDFGNRR